MTNKTKTKIKKKKENIIKREVKEAVQEVKSTFVSSTSFIISALTLVAGLAWNDVAKAYFEQLKEKFSGWGETIGLLLYAMFVTLVAVILVRRLKKIQKKMDGESIKRVPKKARKL